MKLLFFSSSFSWSKNHRQKKIFMDLFFVIILPLFILLFFCFKKNWKEIWFSWIKTQLKMNIIMKNIELNRVEVKWRFNNESFSIKSMIISEIFTTFHMILNIYTISDLFTPFLIVILIFLLKWNDIIIVNTLQIAYNLVK